MRFRTVSTADFKKKKKKVEKDSHRNCIILVAEHDYLYQFSCRLVPYRSVSGSYAVCYCVITDSIIGHIPDDKGPRLFLAFTHWKSEPAEVCVAFTPISHSPDHSARAKACPLMTAHKSSKTVLLCFLFLCAAIGGDVGSSLPAACFRQ